MIDVLDAFSKNKSRDIIFDDDEMKNNKDIKLFNHYIENYENDKNNETKWTRRHLLGDMAVMFSAATDTTYSCLSFSLLLAAKYENIQNELYQEIYNAFGGDLDEIELKNKGITKLPKLRAFIHESLRLFPPAQLSGFREVIDDGVTLEVKAHNKTYNIPKNTTTMTNVVGINQNPKYWIKNYDPINNKK
eukprot:61758_1